MKRIITLAFSLMMVIAVMAADKATVYFSVNPKMSCENCENKIKTNLRYEKGVKQIATCLGQQTVTVTYDPAKTNPDKLKAALKKIGYTATETSAPKGKHEGCSKNKKCDGKSHNCDAKTHKCDGKAHNCDGKAKKCDAKAHKCDGQAKKCNAKSHNCGGCGNHK